MFGLYIDARQGADLLSLWESVQQLQREHETVAPLTLWLGAYGITLTDTGVSIGTGPPMINWSEAPLKRSNLEIVQELISLDCCTLEEQVLLALVLSFLESLNISQIYFSPLAVGIDPKTLQLLRGQAVIFSEKGTTPGFAVLVRKLGGKYDPSRPVMLTSSAQSKSGLTAYLFALDSAGENDVMVVQFQVDDMNPEILGYLQEQAFMLGALDYFITPIQMKKNRPGALVTILCQPDCLNVFIDLIMGETTSIGVRYHRESRAKAQRRLVTVVTPYGSVQVKISTWTDSSGNVLSQCSPEYEDCRRVAQSAKVPIKAVYLQALQQINIAGVAHRDQA